MQPVTTISARLFRKCNGGDKVAITHAVASCRPSRPDGSNVYDSGDVHLQYMVQVTQVRQPRQRRMQGRMYEVGHPDHDRIQLHSILGATLENFLEIPGVK